jgi:hypothetical protein
MAATQAATNPLDLYAHWTRILNGYMGKEVDHIQVTRTLDLQGGVIDEFENDSIIYGAISPVKEESIVESPGMFQHGDLVAYFLSEEGVIVGEQTDALETRRDVIVYQSNRYYVEKRLKTAYDNGVAVVSKYILRKMAIEV